MVNLGGALEDLRHLDWSAFVGLAVLFVLIGAVGAARLLQRAPARSRQRRAISAGAETAPATVKVDQPTRILAASGGTALILIGGVVGLADLAAANWAELALALILLVFGILFVVIPRREQLEVGGTVIRYRRFITRTVPRAEIATIEEWPRLLSRAGLRLRNSEGRVLLSITPSLSATAVEQALLGRSAEPQHASG